MRNILALTALAAATAFAAPAAAQTSSEPAIITSGDDIEASALLIQPATLARLADLSFGTIVATATDAGTVTIDADDGARSNTGDLTLSTVDAGQRGRLIGNGNPGGAVTLRTTFPDFLQNSQDLTETVAFSGTLDSAGASRTIGATGVFYVGVGGTITILAGQMPGLYTGTVRVEADFQ